MITAFFASMDAMIILTGILVGLSGSLIGLFLVLRGASMLTDAASHSIVLGIVIVWMLTGQTSGPLQLLGAAAAGVVSVMASGMLARSGLLRDDAAIGLVFPAFFAGGVLLINLNAGNLHLDTDTVLLGEIGLVWLDTVALSGAEVPVAVATLAAVLAINAAFVALFWKELKLASFDPGLAAALGFAPALLGHALLALTSLTAVAAFDAVGAVLFVAFVIVPPATALLLTDHLGRMLAIAALVAVVAAGAGYPLAVAFDIVIGATMACSAGVVFIAALLLAPGRGLVARLAVRREARAMSDTLALVAHLHTHEGGPEAAEENTVRALSDHLRWGGDRAGRVLLRALDRGLVRRERGLIVLTEKGAAEARRIFEPWARGRAAGGGGADGGAPRPFSAEP